MSPVPLPFIFVVDGGASKTEMELRRADGKVLSRHRAGPCNLYQDAEGGLSAIAAGWDICARQAGFEPAGLARETCLSAGLAGISVANGQRRFHTAFHGFARRMLSSDGYAALVGAFGPAPGALLSIGTGAVGCRFGADDTYARIGGWGFQAGDRGGGAWIGRRFVTAWLEHRDGAGTIPGTPAFWQYVEVRLGDDRGAILEWLRHATPAAFAALVPGVLWAAESGDAAAIALLDAAAKHLARLAEALLAPGPLPLALAGGLAPSIAPYLSAALPPTIPLATEIHASVLEGAWRIAIGDRPPETNAPDTEAMGTCTPASAPE